MDAMIFQKSGQPLKLVHKADPKPATDQLLLKVTACGVCRTDLHIIDNELTKPKLPLIMGHEIVGTVLEIGSAVKGFAIGQRVVVPCLAQTCINEHFCLAGR